MHIVIVGSGYVGLVTGACFSEMGVNVTCVDIDQQKIDNLKKGIIPIFEPGLKELVEKNRENKRLTFTNSLPEAMKDSDIIFIAVGTPPGEDGSADLKYVLSVARSIGQNMTNYTLVVTKSTVPVGSAMRIKDTITAELKQRGIDTPFDVASNPEFLKEGAAILDFMHPDRVVVGIESDRAKKLLERLYKPFTLNGFPILFMDIASAEMTKYASNAMLATRISFMNDIANLCELVGASAEHVRRGMGSDARIGSRFLYPGCGYGGSCFPKDVKALAHTGKQYGYPMQVIEAVEEVNENQKKVLFKKLSSYFNGELKGKTIAIWGLAFKPETDDMREAPALVLIESLLNAGCEVRAFDPEAMHETQKTIGDQITFCKDIYDASAEADAIVLVTEWKQFRMPSWRIIKAAMKGKLIVDGRNIYDSTELIEIGFDYMRIGQK